MGSDPRIGEAKGEDELLSLLDSRQNGRVYQLERDIALLEREGRPLSANADLSEMLLERAPLYARVRDAVVVNNASPEDAAHRDAILRATNGKASRFSCAYKPGATKAHTW